LNLAKWLEDKYGKDSMSMIVDEGTGLVEVWDQVSLRYAAIGTCPASFAVYTDVQALRHPGGRRERVPGRRDPSRDARRTQFGAS
jgi:hypothetical protein